MKVVSYLFATLFFFSAVKSQAVIEHSRAHVEPAKLAYAIKLLDLHMSSLGRYQSDVVINNMILNGRKSTCYYMALKEKAQAQFNKVSNYTLERAYEMYFELYPAEGKNLVINHKIYYPQSYSDLHRGTSAPIPYLTIPGFYTFTLQSTDIKNCSAK